MSTETPNTYWVPSRSIGWVQAMTRSSFGYFDVMAEKIARTVACLVASNGARYSSRVCTRWALVEPRE